MKMTSASLRALRRAAEEQRDAYATMIELDRGVGGLAAEHPEMFDAMIAWDGLTENGFADMVLELLDLVEDLR